MGLHQNHSLRYHWHLLPTRHHPNLHLLPQRLGAGLFCRQVAASCSPGRGPLLHEETWSYRYNTVLGCTTDKILSRPNRENTASRTLYQTARRSRPWLRSPLPCLAWTKDDTARVPTVHCEQNRHSPEALSQDASRQSASDSDLPQYRPTKSNTAGDRRETEQSGRIRTSWPLALALRVSPSKADMEKVLHPRGTNNHNEIHTTPCRKLDVGDSDTGPLPPKTNLRHQGTHPPLHLAFACLS